VITVNPNQEPNGDIVTPAADTQIASGDTVSFSGSVSDPDNNDPVSVVWNFGAGGPPDSTLLNPGPIVFPAVGTYTVTFTATDALGLSDSTPATRVITVVPNEAPDGTIDTPA